MDGEATLHLGSVGGEFSPGRLIAVTDEPEIQSELMQPTVLSKFESGPQKLTVRFDSIDNPSADDIAKVSSEPWSDHFEIRDGKIRPKYVPIRQKVKNPQGRTDFGWDDVMKEKHLRAAWGRGWKEFPYPRPPHNGVLHICGGGPSLRDCLPELRRHARKPRNFIAALNKTHDFLLNLPKLGLGQPIIPWAAALLDPCAWVKDYITPRAGVQYFIGDQCAPETFDVFEKPGLTKWIFRSTKVAGDMGIPPRNSHPIFGGSTVGLRFRTIGYFAGFREIHYWGFDSSAAVDAANPDGRMHGYEKVDSVKDRLSVKIIDEDGFEREFITNSHMARQAQEWLEGRDEWIELYKKGVVQWIKEVFHGDGLLPTTAARLGLHADPKRNNTENMIEARQDTERQDAAITPTSAVNTGATHAG